MHYMECVEASACMLPYADYVGASACIMDHVEHVHALCGLWGGICLMWTVGRLHIEKWKYGCAVSLTDNMLSSHKYIRTYIQTHMCTHMHTRIHVGYTQIKKMYIYAIR
jgi:hypothetical protein